MGIQARVRVITMNDQAVYIKNKKAAEIGGGQLGAESISGEREERSGGNKCKGRNKTEQERRGQLETDRER